MTPITLPFVTLIIPARNEEKFIKLCLESLCQQDYPPDCWEVLVVDGTSRDRTKEVAASYKTSLNLKILDNPKISAPAGLNLGLEKGEGEIIIRVDAHSLVAPDFISQCVRHLAANPEADCVGGPITTIAEGFWAGKIALALSCPFCVADAKFRYAQKPALVDTVAFGAYRRGVFEKIGRFNEALIRNQDIEFSTRLRKSGGKIFLTPEIKSSYFCRASLKSLARQCFLNGYWNIKTSQISPGALKIRHFIPLIFSLFLIITLMAGLFKPFFWNLLIGGLLVYFGMAFLFSAKTAFETRALADFLILPLIFFWFHFTYGLGSIFGLAGFLFKRAKKDG